MCKDGWGQKTNGDEQDGTEGKKVEKGGNNKSDRRAAVVVGGYKMVQLQAKHYFSLLNKRFHGVGQCLAETAECH